MLRLETRPPVSAEQLEEAEALLSREWERDLAYLGDRYAEEDLLRIEATARRLRACSDTFILIGVGGSNGAARAVIEALGRQPGAPEILYAGNGLSPLQLQHLLRCVETREVSALVIAKNFQTLEPGLHFRLIREKMREKYGAKGCARRIAATGTPGSALETLARREGYDFFAFEPHLTGRFSAFHAVALLPMAVAGVSIRRYLTARDRAYAELATPDSPLRRAVCAYAAYRQAAYRAGKAVEVLASCDLALTAFNKWWVQLFGESEGTDKKGLYPDGLCFSEDLHAMGQFIQAGSPVFCETFLEVERYPRLEIPPSAVEDGFDYLTGKTAAQVQEAMVEATWQAHAQEGFPCARLTAESLQEEGFAELFLFFLAAVGVSSHMMGVSPYEQYGVEAYKQRMFAVLQGGQDE